VIAPFLAALALAAPARPAAAATAQPSWYEVGTAARERGDAKTAKEAFLRMLDQDPKSGGAFEGLTLSCLSLGQDEEALGYAKRWAEQSPDSGYVLGLESRALGRLRRVEERRLVDRRIVTVDPCDASTQHRLDDEQRALVRGVFPAGRIYKSIGPEELNTPRPQRIVYAGRSGEVRARQPLKPGLDVVGGASLDEQIQANETGGFTYFDILEQVYSFGLEGRPTRDLAWQAEYGQSELSDVKGSGLGRRVAFSRVKLGAQARVDGWDLDLEGRRQPKYLRGAGGSSYFALLREDDLSARAEGPGFGADWIARAGVSDFSEGTTYKDASVLGTWEYGHELLQPNYSHGEQEYFGAAPTGSLGYVTTDRAGVRWRRLVDDVYRLGASYSYGSYRDGNHEHAVSADATAWLPLFKDLCGARPLYATYRYDAEAYRVPAANYRSTDQHSNTLGVYWKQGWRGAWTTLGYEHSFLVDANRGRYEGNAALLEFEAYRRGDLSVTGSGRVGASNLRDESYSARLAGRLSF
jgi:hypothetical protein